MIRTLQDVALFVPDLDAGEAFYTAMGLESRREGNEVVLRCAGRAQDQVRLIAGPKKAIAWVTWGMRQVDFALLAGRLHALHIPVEMAPGGAPPGGLWLRDPDGVLLHLQVAEPAPQTRPPVEINNPGRHPLRVARRGAPHRDIEARPRKLGHLLKFSTDINRDMRFYTEVLGMKLSDRIGDKLALFLRCGGDSDHHTLALATSEAPGLHHLSWEMGNLDQLQLCAERMIGAGYRDGWGVGRHIYGSNYFHYVRDPWMGLNELFWDMDFIPEGSPWQVEVPEEGPDALYQWATMPPPEDFLKNYERLK
jgi:catechol 2,3-dioxygenase-like lactoylglutathione lyase family enzyme